MKRIFEGDNGKWEEKLMHVLWAYKTTPYSTMGETLFKLTYGTKVISLVEIRELSWRRAHRLQEEENTQAIREKVDLLEEKRTLIALMSDVVKKETTTKYNKWIKPQRFQPKDLVLRWADVEGKNGGDGKLASN